MFVAGPTRRLEIEMTTTTTPELITIRERRICRLAAGVERGDSVPVRLVPGAAAPRLVGDGFHWTNRRGDRVWHPNAYSRVGFSSLVYRPSTRAVEVGVRWLDRRQASRAA
jgi:hypothetical protein